LLDESIDFFWLSRASLPQTLEVPIFTIHRMPVPPCPDLASQTKAAPILRTTDRGTTPVADKNSPLILDIGRPRLAHHQLLESGTMDGLSGLFTNPRLAFAGPHAIRVFFIRVLRYEETNFYNLTDPMPSVNGTWDTPCRTFSIERRCSPWAVWKTDQYPIPSHRRDMPADTAFD